MLSYVTEQPYGPQSTALATARNVASIEVSDRDCSCEGGILIQLLYVTIETQRYPCLLLSRPSPRRGKALEYTMPLTSSNEGGTASADNATRGRTIAHYIMTTEHKLSTPLTFPLINASAGSTKLQCQSHLISVTWLRTRRPRSI